MNKNYLEQLVLNIYPQTTRFRSAEAIFGKYS